ncbi:MAG: hypothetical protein IJC13_04960 [Clostridia bacterium]|nr:hypothetical protein [Clostridia bacterium]
MLPKNYIKIRGQMISAPTELNCNSCFALLYTRKARKQQTLKLCRILDCTPDDLFIIE